MAGGRLDIQQDVISAIVVAIVAAAIPGAVALWQSRDKARLDERASYYSAIRADVDELRGRLDALEGYDVGAVHHLPKGMELDRVVHTWLKPRG